MEQILTNFATRYRARFRSNGDEMVAPGRLGEIANHGDGRLALIFLADADDPRHDKILRSRIRRGIAAGMEPHQVAECEAVLLFSPDNPKLSRLALSLAGCRRRRATLSASQRAVLLRGRDNLRRGRGAAKNGPQTAQSGTISAGAVS